MAEATPGKDTVLLDALVAEASNVAALKAASVAAEACAEPAGNSVASWRPRRSERVDVESELLGLLNSVRKAARAAEVCAGPPEFMTVGTTVDAVD